MEKFWTDKEEKSGRYPWTYSADAIRSWVDIKISRSDAAHIKANIAKAIGMDERELAEKIAAYHIQRSER